MKVTIGLSVYNAEKYLKDCMNSILNQSYSTFNLLIIDDGSTDSSIDIIKGFNDKRIKLIVDGQNRGLPYRLNQIAELCVTKYLARMDADDIMHIDRIKLQIEALEAYPEINVLGTNYYVIDGANQITGIRFDNNDIVADVDRFLHPSILAESEWYKRNPYNIKLKKSQDSELWERSRNHSNFKRLNIPLMFYREVSEGYYKKYWMNLKSKGVILSMYVKKRRYQMAICYFFKDYLKTFIVTFSYSIAAVFNLEKVLIDTRSQKLSAKHKLKAQFELDKVISDF